MKTTVAIIGGGPAGSSCAINLAKLGITSTIVERESFPRFHIGESLTEQSGACLREMGFDEAELSQTYLTKYGVNIYGPSGRRPFWVPVMKRDAHGELKDTFTWQVRRASFDQMLLQRATDSGATLLSGRAREALLATDGSLRGISVSTKTTDVDLECDVLVDASGQSTFLSRAGLASAKLDGRYSQQVAVYSHFTGAERDPGIGSGNTLVFFQRKYHWAWFIPIDGVITSIGFVIPMEYFRSRGETPRDFLVRELKEFNRNLGRRVKGSEFADEVRTTSNYSYVVEEFVGRNWLCIGDSHRFIDPLFSMGVGISLSEGRNAARAIRAHLDGASADCAHPFREFQESSREATGACQTILDGFWESTYSFGLLLTRHRDDIIDMLAGHVWDGQKYAALNIMRETLERQQPARTGAVELHPG